MNNHERPVAILVNVWSNFSTWEVLWLWPINLGLTQMSSKCQSHGLKVGSSQYVAAWLCVFEDLGSRVVSTCDSWSVRLCSFHLQWNRCVNLKWDQMSKCLSHQKYIEIQYILQRRSKSKMPKFTCARLIACKILELIGTKVYRSFAISVS